MKEVKIIDLITLKISGEWGEESLSNSDTNIIRTANFTNNGEVNFSKVTKRTVNPKTVEQKKLQDGDIIIEKSGGSPTQPVGRVVYFEAPNSEKYLCNNFTTILRPNRELVNPKYFFYLLYYNYQLGKTKSFQNKTTGIINLKLDRYLHSSVLFESDLETQDKIVAILDKTKNLVKKKLKSITCYNELLRSAFWEIFGEPMKRPNNFKIDNIGKYVIDIIAGTSYGGEEKKSLEDDELGVLKISAVTKGIFNPHEFKAVKKNIINKNLIYPKKGDLLFSRANTLELVGATCIVEKDYNHLFLPDKIWNIVIDEKRLSKIYLHYVLQNKNVRKTFLSIATGSSSSMLNISMDKFKNILIPIPPPSLQKKFELIYYNCSKNIERLNISYLHANTLLKACQQLAFKGKLTFNTAVDLETLLNGIDVDKKEEENDISGAKVNPALLQLLLQKLSIQEFDNLDQYKKAKYVAFRILKEDRKLISQTFDEINNKVTLNM